MSGPWLPISEITEADKQSKLGILGWCNHEADPGHEPMQEGDPPGSYRLTIYGGHLEGLNHPDNGPNVLVWGGSFQDHEDDGGAYLPDWWFVRGSEFEIVANPTHFQRITPLEIIP